MKLIFITSFLLIFSNWSIGQATELNLKFTNLIPATGNIHIGIYNSEDGFPEVDKTYWNKIDKVSSNIYSLTVNELPPGEYCISVFHDKNANDKFDFNFIGYPLETYGFSKNIFHMFRASTFQECAFILKDIAEYSIKLVK